VRLARPAEDVRRHNAALVLACVGEQPYPGDVADCPQSRPGGHAGVDGDAARVGGDADRLQPDALDPESSTGRNQEAITTGLRPVRQLQDVFPAVQAGCRRRHAQPKLDALRPEGLGDALAQSARLPRQQVIGALDHRDSRAHPGEGLRHLHADGATPEHQQSPRNLGEAGDLPVGPQAGQLCQAGHRRNRRVGSGGDDNVLRGIGRPVDRDGVRAGQPAATAHHLDTGTPSPRHLPGVVVIGHLEIAPGERRRYIHTAGDGFAGAGCSARRRQRFPRSQQGLGRDAAPVRAFPTEQLALHNGDMRTARGERRGTVFPRRSGAENDHIKIGTHGHRPPSSSESRQIDADLTTLTPFAASSTQGNSLAQCLVPERSAFARSWTPRQTREATRGFPGRVLAPRSGTVNGRPAGGHESGGRSVTSGRLFSHS
jgi:hypothetical protein